MHARAIKLLVVGVFLVLVLAQAGKKFVLDEIDFPVIAQTISVTGVPVYYRGEESPALLGLYHPPLYIYSLAAFVKAFGYSEITVRIFGALCTLISAFLALRVYRRIFDKPLPREHFGIVFLPLFLLHPYTVANTLVPDIDQTVLPIAILLFFLGLLREVGPDVDGRAPFAQREAPIRPPFLLGALFALTLWAKLTTPLALLPATLVMFLLSGYPLLRAVASVSMIAIVGVALFVGTYWIYCAVSGLPFDFTFNFLVHSFTKGAADKPGVGATFQKLVQNFSYVRQFVNWLTLPYVFAFLAAIAYLASRWKHSYEERLLLVLGLFAASVTAIYLCITGPFGSFFKYPYAVFAVLGIPVAHLLSRVVFSAATEDGHPGSGNAVAHPTGSESALPDFRRIGEPARPGATQAATRQPGVIAVFAGIVLLLGYYQIRVAKDHAILADQPVDGGVLWAFAVLAVATGVVFGTGRFRTAARYAGATLAAVLIGTQVGIVRTQAVAAYPITYHYGQSGMEETVAYLKARVRENEPVFAMKDVGYYVNNRYFENYRFIFDEAPEPKFQDLIDSKGVRFFVVTKGIGQDRVDAYAAFKRALDACCMVEKEFGNFIIYRARNR